MNTNKKALLAVAMVAIMLAVPFTIIGDTEQSEATSVAPAGSNYAYRVTVPSTSEDISEVYDLLNSTAMTAVGNGTTGDWTWDSTTGVGPFNMFYAAISLGESDDNAISNTAGQIAYILDPFDLSKALRGRNFNGVSTDISSVIGLYNIMLVIPTVYVATTTDGESGATYLYLTNNTSQQVFSGLSLIFSTYAHTARSGDADTTYPYLGIGVYESSIHTFGSVSDKLLSQSGATPTASQNIQTFRGQLPSVDTSYGAYQLWNFYEWTLYKMIAQTMIGSVDVQGHLDATGRTQQGSPGTTGMADSQGPVYANNQVGKVLIENAWGSLWDIIDNIYVASGTLHIGNGLESTLSSASVGVTGNDSQVSFTLSGTSGRYIETASRDAATWDIPLTLTSESTEGGLHDLCWYSNSDNRILMVGGDFNCEVMAGLSCWYSSGYLSALNYNIGARSAYLMTTDAVDVTVTYSARIAFHEWDATNGGYADAAQNYTSVSSMSANMVPQPIASDINYEDADYEFAGWRVATTAPTSIQTTGVEYVPGNIYNVGVISATQDTYIHLYAVYELSPSTYTVTVNKNQDGATADYTMSVSAGSAIILPQAAEIDGYAFNGWHLATSTGTYLGQPGAYYKPTGDCILVPVYTALEYWTITLMQWDGSGTASTDYTTGSTIQVIKTQSTQMPQAKFFENYVLRYWASDAGGTTQVAAPGQIYTPTANITLYPIYGAAASAATYTVTIMDTTDGTVYTAGDQVKVQDGSSIRLPTAPAVANMVFDHWSTYTTAVQPDNIGVTGQYYQPAADVSIAPVYVNAITVTVYKVTGGLGTETITYDVDLTMQVKSGEPFMLPTAAVQEGYALSGWATSGNSTTSIGVPGQYYSVSAAASLYPIYSATGLTGTLTVTFDRVATAPSTYEVDYTAEVANGYPIMLPKAPALTGYAFQHWATSDGAASPTYTAIGVEGQYYTPVAEVTLYPVYSAIPTSALTLAYILDGSASTAEGVQDFITATLSATSCEIDGYVYLTVVKNGAVCSFDVSATGAYVVPLVSGLYRIIASEAAATVTVNVNSQYSQGYEDLFVSGISNQGRTVQVKLYGDPEAGLAAGTLDIGGVYCYYNSELAQWVYGSIENLSGVDAQEVTAGDDKVSTTFTLPENYRVYYVYGIYTVDGNANYGGGQLGPAAPTLVEN